jgi:Arc/MetJ-type ribon-helix-helix transcriptional regulator
MPTQFKRIHMPRPLYKEIEKFVSKQDSPYKTAAELCREAGRMLTDHYKLREKYA